LVKKEARRSVLLLSMGYKKDIFGSFAHEFELSQKMIYHLWRYDIRRCRMIYLLHKRDIISVPSYAIGIYHPPKVDIISKIYHPFRKERISLKNDKFLSKLVVFLCKDYKKDIFGRFAYDFELSQNILSFLI